MRIALWIAFVFFSILFLMAGVPWATSKEFRGSSWGREFRVLLLALAIILATLGWSLVKGPVPAAAP
ncbi:MAG TPA: hypothetical protein VF950_08980 [Planctomycetota bacterium]